MGAICVLLSVTVAGCGLREDHGPVGSVRNDTSEEVVVSYRSAGGATAPWEMELSSGQTALAIAPFQAFARSGCLPGTLVATQRGRVIAEMQGLCADQTWAITAPQTIPASSS
jgi:hypothetical protein